MKSDKEQLLASYPFECLVSKLTGSQREVNGKSTSECGELVTVLYSSCNGQTNETPKKVCYNTGESVVSEIRKKRSRSETAMSRNQTKITFFGACFSDRLIKNIK